MELKASVANKIKAVAKTLYGIDVDVNLTVPDEQFGDFATNVAMQLVGKVEGNPRDIAQKIADELVGQSLTAEVAGPGFINITVSDHDLWQSLTAESATPYTGQSWVVEYSCPNYFKELHAGHLYQTLVGDVIARLIERAGANVHRTNFGGDVGLHVAKAIYGMNKTAYGEFNSQENSKTLELMDSIIEGERSKFLTNSYVLGSKSYEDEENTKHAVGLLNADLYSSVFSEYANDHDDKGSQELREVFEKGREWSRSYFDTLYADLRLERQKDGTFFRYYPESETVSKGMDIVRSELVSRSMDMNARESIFTNSKNAVVFKGEEYGLHTRVFITGQDLPTYETKDLGLIFNELEDYNFDHRVLITGSDQAQYMKVVWKVADLLESGIGAKMTHLTNGIIKFGDGKKMSSRSGNVTSAIDVLETVRGLVGRSEDPERDERIALGAVKYEFLKYRLGGDIAFDPEESVSLQGNSGPYLQYALVRAKGILKKILEANTAGEGRDTHDIIVSNNDPQFDKSERSLVRKLSHYTTAVDQATSELAPHIICTYLYELAQEFNRFYENSHILGDNRQKSRWEILSRYYDVLENGLALLGIQAPDKM